MEIAKNTQKDRSTSNNTHTKNTSKQKLMVAAEYIRHRNKCC